MATREDIYAAIRNADKAGDTESVRKLGAYLQTMDDPAAPAPEGSRARAAKQSDGLLTKAVENIIPGAIRGAGSIGSTLIELGRTGNPALGGQAPGTLMDRYRERTGGWIRR
jgi:hypothetical protein